VHMHAPGPLPFQKKKRIITMKIVLNPTLKFENSKSHIEL
jgi:hypothetical protein